MAFTSAFFDAELVSGEYDRVYSAEKFAEYFASFIANGVFPDPSTNLQVVANTVNDMNVLVSPGMGWINGYYCKNDDFYPLAVQAASGTLNRIDAVVIGWSRTNREITTYIKTGTAASSPTSPTLTRNADLYELMLATITVNAGVTQVTQSMITDKRADTSVCGWVAGVVQQIDTTDLFAQYDDAFQTWFSNIQAQLEGDVATNLQKQINGLSIKVDENFEKTLSNETKTLYGLGADAVPDDALRVLSRLHSGLANEYVWEKSAITQVVENGSSSSKDLGWSYADSVQYSNTVSIINGVITLNNPGSIAYTSANKSSILSAIKGKYFKVVSSSSSAWTYGVVLDIGSSDDGTGVHFYFYNLAVKENKQVVGYVNSPNPNAYPPAEDNGYTYQALGILGEKTKFATGSYTGTGKDGSSNKNSLTFSFAPKLVLITMLGSTSYTDDGVLAVCINSGSKAWSIIKGGTSQQLTLSWGDNALSWYSGSYRSQLNVSGELYGYIAIG